MTSCRQNFQAEVENAFNNQINMELYASHVYLTIANFYDQDDVALKGFHKFFLKMSDEEREHARKMMRYQNQRGGRVVISPVTAPPELLLWNSPLTSMQTALDMEKKVNQSLLDLHAIASRTNDAAFCDFIENEFLQEQVKSIKELSDHITNIRRVGDGLGVFVFDRELSS
uniref:Ferritin n=1 Tax=Orthetrum albistylum TaxID=254766 RepID=A0A499UNC4_9ODON|nr:ferritin [Orthetrum albistylum]